MRSWSPRPGPAPQRGPGRAGRRDLRPVPPGPAGRRRPAAELRGPQGPGRDHLRRRRRRHRRSHAAMRGGRDRGAGRPVGPDGRRGHPDPGAAVSRCAAGRDALAEKLHRDWRHISFACVPSDAGPTKARRVTDVVQPPGRLQEIGVRAQNRCQAACPRDDALDVRPAAGRGTLSCLHSSHRENAVYAAACRVSMPTCRKSAPARQHNRQPPSGSGPRPPRPAPWPFSRPRDHPPG